MMQEENALNNNVLYQKSLQLSIEFLQIAKDIMKENDYTILAPLTNQAVRSTTSITANICEASSFSCSKKDRRAKLSISLKEANETTAWFTILYEIGKLSQEQYEKLNDQLTQVQKMLSKSIKTIDSRL